MKKETLRKKIQTYRMEIITVSCVLFFQFILYRNVLIGQIYPDSYSYMKYSFKGLLRGELLNSRPPGYPLLIRLCYYLLGEEYYLTGVAAVQMIIFAVCCYYLYQTCLIVTSSDRRCSLICAALFGSSPSVLGWNTFILTESLSISGVVFFLYFIVSYIHSPRKKTGVQLIACTFLMTFIKPALVIFFAGVSAFFVLRILLIKEERKLSGCLLLISAILAVLMLAYSFLIMKNFGTFALTDLAPRHLLAACLRSGIYQAHPDKEMVGKIAEIYAGNNYSIDYVTTTPVMELFGTNYIERQRGVTLFCDTCLRYDFKGYLLYLYAVARDNITNSYGAANEMMIQNEGYKWAIAFQNAVFNWVKTGHLYLCAIGEGITAFYIWMKKKEFSWVHFGISAMILSNLMFIYVGTYEFVRCTVYLLPFVYLSSSMLLKNLVQKAG